MEITIKYYDKTFIIKQHDDCNTQNMKELFRSIMSLMTFHPDLIKEVIREDDE